MFLNILFLLSALLTVGGALLVALSKNLMHSCIFLLASLFGVSGLYVTLSADFLAATQLVVYAGGVVILMLFAIMLTGGAEGKVNRFGINKIPSMGNLKTYAVGVLTSLVVGMVVVHIALKASGFLDVEVKPFESTVEKLGTLLITDHVLAFEISSILLLGALVGAAVIARPRKG